MRRICAIAATTLCALVAVFAGDAWAAPVSVQRSGWLWGNPTPQGETLNQVVFDGAGGYAVGEHGTVLVSHDEGAEWAGTPSGTEANLTQLQLLGDGTVVLGGGCTLRESAQVSGFAVFRRLAVNESESNCATQIASFSFLNASTGWVEQANGSVLYTSDGGQSFAARTAVPLDGGSAVQIDFISQNVGFALVDDAAGEGHIYRTSDGAGSWTQVATAPASEPLADMTIVSASAIYAVGGAGGTSANANVLLFSEDEGQEWTQRPLALPGSEARLAPRQIACSDALHCAIATAEVGGKAANVLIRTSDGGMTGTSVVASDEALRSVSFAGGSHLVAVGDEGATVLSPDGGETFPTQVSQRLAGSPAPAIAIGGEAGGAYLAGGSGQITYTTDNGYSWGTMQVPTSATLLGVSFPFAQVGYAVSNAGTLYRTSDGGQSWAILSGGEPPSSVLAPNSSTVLLIGPTGLRRSTSSGTGFEPVGGSVVMGRVDHRLVRRSLSAFPLYAGAQVAGSAVIAWGEDAIESTNGGASWTLIPTALHGASVEALSFVSAETGYEVCRQRLFFTRDGGRRWSEVVSLGTQALGGRSDLSFSSASDGYALAAFDGSHDVIMRTEDGGHTWAPEVLPRGVEAVAAGAGAGYAFGAGSLFATTDGGVRAGESTQLALGIHGARVLTRAELRRRGGRVQLTGRLSPATGEAQVTVSWRAAGRSVWQHRQVTTASDGSFSLNVSGVGSTTDFVAQWEGEWPESGAGSAAAVLTVRGR
jgi:photosystem II stability/assembly factor-like uncharacterized protein